jgi:hypothetical protein
MKHLELILPENIHTSLHIYGGAPEHGICVDSHIIVQVYLRTRSVRTSQLLRPETSLLSKQQCIEVTQLDNKHFGIFT